MFSQLMVKFVILFGLFSLCAQNISAQKTNKELEKLCLTDPESKECKDYTLRQFCEKHANRNDPLCNEYEFDKFCLNKPSDPKCVEARWEKYCKTNPYEKECVERAEDKLCKANPDSNECKAIHFDRMCKRFPSAPECLEYQLGMICKRNPLDPRCKDSVHFRCKLDPGSDECKALYFKEYCQVKPLDPDCVEHALDVFCKINPDDAKCKDRESELFCKRNPTNFKCVAIEYEKFCKKYPQDDLCKNNPFEKFCKGGSGSISLVGQDDETKRRLGKLVAVELLPHLKFKDTISRSDAESLREMLNRKHPGEKRERYRACINKLMERSEGASFEEVYLCWRLLQKREDC